MKFLSLLLLLPLLAFAQTVPPDDPLDNEIGGNETGGDESWNDDEWNDDEST